MRRATMIATLLIATSTGGAALADDTSDTARSSTSGELAEITSASRELMEVGDGILLGEDLDFADFSSMLSNLSERSPTIALFVHGIPVKSPDEPDLVDGLPDSYASDDVVFLVPEIDFDSFGVRFDMRF